MIAMQLGIKQMIMNKIPNIDINTLHGQHLSELDQLLNISRTIEQMAPSRRSMKMLEWMLEQLKFFKMFNSRLVHQKVMTKSNFLRFKTEQFVFVDPISRSMQTQLEVFLEAINFYFAERLEKNNILIELNCAFSKTDIFEPITMEYRATEDDLGTVELLEKPFTIDHQEGDIISIVFIDARRGQGNDHIKPEFFYEHVTQYMIGIFIPEDASDNNVEGVLPGLVGLKAQRRPSKEILMKKLGRNDEL